MALTNPHIYLAGPITGTNASNSVSWRQEVQSKLSSFCTFDDPTSRPMHVTDKLTTKERERIGKTVVKDDESGVESADIVLVNLKDAGRISIGSMIEVAWAALANKNIVLIIDDGNVHQSDLLLSEDCVSFITDNLSEACDYIKSFSNGVTAVHDRSFPMSNSRSFNILVQTIQNHAQNDVPLILNLRHYKAVSIDAVFLLALAYKMNVESVLYMKEGSVYDHAMVREIVTKIR